MGWVDKVGREQASKQKTNNNTLLERERRRISKETVHKAFFPHLLSFIFSSSPFLLFYLFLSPLFLPNPQSSNKYIHCLLVEDTYRSDAFIEVHFEERRRRRRRRRRACKKERKNERNDTLPYLAPPYSSPSPFSN